VTACGSACRTSSGCEALILLGGGGTAGPKTQPQNI